MDLSLLLLIFLQIPSSREEFLSENDKFPFIRPISKGNNSVRSKRNINISLARNVTFLLDSVLRNYNRQFRPGFNTIHATPVFIDIMVNTMGPVSELKNTFMFSCYFRQTWTDPRLSFNGTTNRQVLSLSMAMLDRIWKPDTFFWNGARSYIHTMTTSNRLVRLHQDGTVLYSSRLTIQGHCSMSMNRYPLDRQACRLLIGSYAYSSKELSYTWNIVNGDKGVQIDKKGMADLPQFSLTGIDVFDAENVTRDRDYSVLEARFYFERHFGYFLMNFYVPCTLIVLLCWVAFWTNREATGDRMGMGITSVLTMVLIANDSKKDAPKVDIPTALDVYIWICYTTLFISMVEFTVVHYYTKFNTGDPEIQAAEREKLRQIIRNIPKDAGLSQRNYNRARNPPQDPPIRKITHPGQKIPCSFSRRDGGRHSMYHRNSKRQRERKTTNPQRLNTAEEDREDKDQFHKESVGWRLYYMLIDHTKKTDPFGLVENSSSMVDRFARVALPLIFSFIVLLYYQFYVNTPQHFYFHEKITFS